MEPLDETLASEVAAWEREVDQLSHRVKRARTEMPSLREQVEKTTSSDAEKARRLLSGPVSDPSAEDIEKGLAEAQLPDTIEDDDVSSDLLKEARRGMKAARKAIDDAKRSLEENTHVAETTLRVVRGRMTESLPRSVAQGKCPFHFVCLIDETCSAVCSWRNKIANRPKWKKYWRGRRVPPKRPQQDSGRGRKDRA